MTDKSAFTDCEWHALTDAPLLVTTAVFFAGEHGPISIMKEASASARSISKPGERWDRERAHRPDRHRGQHKRSESRTEGAPRSDVPGRDRQRATRARAGGGGAQEAAAGRSRAGRRVVRRRYAEAVAQSAKTVNPDEQTTIEKLAALFAV